MIDNGLHRASLLRDMTPTTNLKSSLERTATGFLTSNCMYLLPGKEPVDCETGTSTLTMNCKEHHLPELELATGQAREALQAILYTILL